VGELNEKSTMGMVTNEACLFENPNTGDAYRTEPCVILREEDMGGRVMVMMDEERVQPEGRTEKLILNTFVDFFGQWSDWRI